MNKNELKIFQPEIRVKKVSFENFRGFEELEQQIESPLTVFIGQNGSGKTAILEGIAKLLTVFENQIRGELSTSIPTSGFIAQSCSSI
jgi:predicted ATP-binding protein involved in virulence